jgi:glycerol uptake facilitator-like aquaporin
MTDSEPGMTLIWEFLSTFFVVFVVYAVTFNKDFKPIGPFAIGVRWFLARVFLNCLINLQLAVTAATFASGPFTGSSFNPSRTLAAAFVFGSFHQVHRCLLFVVASLF